MTVQAVTLSLPQATYEQIRQAAEKAQRPLDEVLVEAVTAVAPVIGSASEQLRTGLAQMAYLNDAALWQAARATMSTEQRERLEMLHHRQQQQQGLTDAEKVEEQALLTLYRETLLIRAQAVVLLKGRGYDISDPQQFTPLQ